MAINTIRLDYDTCDCSHYCSYDTSINPPVFTLVGTGNICQFHSSVSLSNLLSVVLEENGRKNNSIQAIVDAFPSLLSTTGAAGGGLKTFDVNGDRNVISVNFAWSGTAPNRVLTLTPVGFTLTTSQKNAAQNKANQLFGVGKVVINT